MTAKIVSSQQNFRTEILSNSRYPTNHIFIVGFCIIARQNYLFYSIRFYLKKQSVGCTTYKRYIIQIRTFQEKENQG
jgi:hypothetical protein